MMLAPSVPSPAPAVTYFTVSTNRFFLGTVALLNSLRLTQNAGELVVLDAGLTARQRELLTAHARVVAVPKTSETHPVLTKTYAYLSAPSGMVVVIDSDMIVTGSLDPVLALAAEGKICVYPDVPAVRGRWFPEWAKTLRLRSPLRPDIYVNSGFVAFSAEQWPRLLERWREVCELIPHVEMWRSRSPFNAPDQDALNALLMSEIPREALALLPERENAFGGDAVVEDFRALRCTWNGRPTRILHLLDSPKPWEPSGWLRLAGTAYARLMRRLLFADDVRLRLDHHQAPLWLRPSRRGEATLRTLGALNRAVVRTASALPEPLRTPLRQVRRWFAYGKAHRREVGSAQASDAALGVALQPVFDCIAEAAVLGQVAFSGFSTSFMATAALTGLFVTGRRIVFRNNHGREHGADIGGN